jgi:hypothetical protein
MDWVKSRIGQRRAAEKRARTIEEEVPYIWNSLYGAFGSPLQPGSPTLMTGLLNARPGNAVIISYFCRPKVLAPKVQSCFHPGR